MSTPQLLEDEDVAIALRDCDGEMLSTICESAIACYLLGGDGIEIELGSKSGAGDVTLRAQPARMVEAVVAECIARHVPHTDQLLAEWRAIVARVGRGW